MRAAVYEAYSGNGWGHKVDNMSDVQVQAVYFSMLERGLFDRLKKDSSCKKQPNPEPKKTTTESMFEPPPAGEQLSFF
jgi:hypothetical protein